MGKYNRPGDKLSPWWGAIVRSQGVNPKAPSHEFRHTVKNEFRSLGVPDSLSDLITAQSSKSVGARYGRASLEVPKREIDRIGELQVSRIYSSHSICPR